jgi:sigma-B regulation protein RsbU (phosphoserine phosphatase)
MDHSADPGSEEPAKSVTSSRRVNHTATDVLAMFRADIIASVIAVVLCAMGVGMLLLGALSARRSRSSFLYTGLFAIVYGTRLGMNTASFGMLSEHPRWLDYVRSAFEYLVPIPAALLFGSFSGRRWRAGHRVIIGALVLCAVVAIPYELLIQTPYAMKRVIDALVIVLLAVLALDLLWPGEDSDSWRLVRIGAAVFAAFVLNEHFRFVHDPYGLTREPTGFLFLMLTIVITTMQRGTRAQERLVAVDSELATARRIQMAALPNTNPNLPGLEVASFYKPASDVAGDFYDFLELDNGCLGVFIADVSGHGVPAALVASMLKIALATQSENASSPARVLAALNALFCGRLERQFITAAYIHLDPGKGRIITASAGHPPPILRRTNRTAEEIIAPGVVLGRFRDAQYEEITTPFSPGDTLVLYTDGITETINGAGEMWGDDRLRTTIASRDCNNVAELGTTILNEAANWRGVSGAPDDDVTLIVVNRVVV